MTDNMSNTNTPKDIIERSIAKYPNKRITDLVALRIHSAIQSVDDGEHSMKRVFGEDNFMAERAVAAAFRLGYIAADENGFKLTETGSAYARLIHGSAWRNMIGR